MKYNLIDTDQSLITTVDVTTMNKFCVCPRMYFFIRMMGLIPSHPILNLIHGRAWHAAKRYLLMNGLDQTNLNAAMDEYEKIYRLDFSIAQDDYNTPKNPTYSRDSLELYIEQYKHRPREIIGTERSGNIFTLSGHALFFKLDLLERDSNSKIWVVDHKTTGTRSELYAEVLRLSNQMTVYMAAANMYFENVGGVRVERSLFLKSELSHHDFIINNNPAEIMMIMNAVDYTMSSIQANLQTLFDEDIKHYNDPNHVMVSFPLCTENCIQYMRMCTYRPLCLSCTNPLSLPNVPLGYMQEYWDPLKDEDNNNG